MYPSATLCRAQQAQHEKCAATTTLENVRRRSVAAAKAWGAEALNADRRDAMRIGRPLTNVRPETELDALLSENPDRGSAAF